MTNETTQWNPDRTETAITSIADSSDEILGQVGGHTVLVQTGAAANPNCQHTLLTTVNLLARLDTVIDAIHIVVADDVAMTVQHPGTTANTIDAAVKELADQIGSPVDVSLVEEPGGTYDAAVVLGDATVPSADMVVHAGSNGWLAHVATMSDPVEFGEKVNPIGAYTAGCLAVAEVFKHGLQQDLGDAVTVNIEPVDDVVFSTLDYSVNAADPANPPLPEPVYIETVHIFGVGAGGGALVHVLSAVASLTGTVHLVDSDEVSRSNLNRYIWAFAEDVDAMKTVVGQQRLRAAHADLNVMSSPEPYADFAEDADSSAFDLVVSTVDSVEAREEIQWDFPRVILDAATNQQGSYVVSRVELGATQCLGCKHQQREGKQRELSVVADRIGLDVDTVLEMDKDNAAFTAEQVATIDAAVDDESDTTVPDVGERFSDWFGEQCGHMELTAAADPVPAPFLPVTAGVLLAGEVIKDRYFPDYCLDNKFTHNMFYRPRERLHKFTGPDSSCPICQNDRVIDHYHEKWGDQP